MFKMACSTKGKRYVLLQGEDESKVRGNIICRLTLVGRPYLQMWIAAGIAKNFKYKRAIDLGILKLMEVGLLDALIERRLPHTVQNDINVNKTEAIRMDQVSLVIEVMCCGIIIAFIILVIEKIVYAYKLKQS
nr:PREDICTED: uncharacterized protein LOC105673403 [Linepithema humile]